MSSSRIDVIVPCYRYGHLLHDCVQSVLSQRGVNVRVLILDDASPDDTEAVARALAGKDERVELRRHATNRGHLPTFNEGLDWASGDYTLLLSADDLLAPGALQRAAEMLDQNPNVGFVYGRAVTMRDETPADMTAVADGYTSRIIPGDQFLHDACHTGDNVVLTPSVIVRTALQKKLGGYHARLVHTGDFEMWMRFAAYGDVGFIDTTQAFYRVHGQNMSAGYSRLRDIEQRQAAFDVLFDAHARQIKHADALRHTARQALATTAFWAGNQLFDDGDVDACKSFHELAIRIDPSMNRSGAWRRFQLKRLIGPAGWLAIRPLFWRMKRKTA
ncbi:glycosyltransferase family 2 protein [soil metagenome]